MQVDQIRFINDAECFLRGEAFCGAAKYFNSALGLTLGTGLGTAWYRDGVAEDAALWDSSFKDGIAEDYLGSAWFINRYKELTGIKIKNVKELVLITDADPEAKYVFNEFGENLADFLGPFINKNKPQALVIGGNIAKAYDLFYPSLDSGFKKQSINISLLTAKLGEEAALIGAASCWSTSHSESF
jgi:glucokinase